MRAREVLAWTFVVILSFVLFFGTRTGSAVAHEESECLSTPTPVPTATATAIAMPTVTATPVVVPTATATATAIPSPTATAVPTPTAAPTPTATATPIPTATPTPTATSTPTAGTPPISEIIFRDSAGLTHYIDSVTKEDVTLGYRFPITDPLTVEFILGRAQPADLLAVRIFLGLAAEPAPVPAPPPTAAPTPTAGTPPISEVIFRDHNGLIHYIDSVTKEDVTLGYRFPITDPLTVEFILGRAQPADLLAVRAFLALTVDPAPVRPDRLPSITQPLSNEVLSVHLGETFTFQIRASDPEGQELTYWLSNRPTDLEIDQNGLLTWHVSYGFSSRRYQVSFYISDRSLAEMDNPTRKVPLTFFIDVLPPKADRPAAVPTPTATPTQTTTATSSATATPTPSPTQTPPASGSGTGGAGGGIPSPTPTPMPEFPSYGVIVGPPSEPTFEQELVDIGQELDELEELVREIQQTADALSHSSTYGVVVEDINPIDGIPASFTFTKPLWFGIWDTEVKYLQIMLNADSETRLAQSGPGSPGQETIYFGSLTKAAVKKFQEKYWYEILSSYGMPWGTGIVGTHTRDKLNELLEEEREKIWAIVSGNADSEVTRLVREQEEQAEENRQFLADILDFLFVMQPELKIGFAVSSTVKSGKTAQTFLQTVKGILRSVPVLIKTAPGNLRNAGNEILAILKALRKVATVDIAVLRHVVRSEADVVRIVKLVDQNGDEALNYVKKMVGTWKTGVRVRTLPEDLVHAWNGHNWQKLGLRNKEELQVIIEEVVSTGRRGFQNHPQEGYQFIFQKGVRFPNGKVYEVFVPVRESGAVRTAFEVKSGFFEKRPWFLELK